MKTKEQILSHLQEWAEVKDGFVDKKAMCNMSTYVVAVHAMTVMGIAQEKVDSKKYLETFCEYVLEADYFMMTPLINHLQFILDKPLVIIKETVKKEHLQEPDSRLEFIKLVSFTAGWITSFAEKRLGELVLQ